MGKEAIIYGKKKWEHLQTIYDVEEYYCINGLFYIKAKDHEYYFSLDQIGSIEIDSESEA